MRTKENTNLRKNLQNYLEEIRQDYLSGMKAVKVAEKWGVSEATMRRFLSENSISMKRRNLKDPTLLQEMKGKIEQMKNTHTVTEICKSLGINHSKYAEIMNIPSNNKENRNDINESFVNIQSKEFCYFLGFFMADGSFEQSRIRIYQSDSNFLHKLQNIMSHKGVIRKDCRSINTNYCLDINSPKLKELLLSLKVDSNKKFTAPFVNCGLYTKDFIRGVFDGDGCLSYTYTSGSFKNVLFDITSGSINMIKGISEFLKSVNIEHSINEFTNVNTYYNIRISSIDMIITLLNILYDDSDIVKLDRKYINFVKFKKLVELNRKINDIVDTNLKELE